MGSNPIGPVIIMKNLEEWIEELKNSNKLIIVEGLKDKIALEALGIKGIITINKPFYKLIEDISKLRECILLVDLDREGRRIYNQLSSQLQKNRIKVDNRFREFLFKNTKLTQIEGLTRYLIKNNINL